MSRPCTIDVRSCATEILLINLTGHLDVLQSLRPVAESRYDSVRGGCIEGTRVGILAQLLAWATDPDSQPVYWMSGMAGAGKTSIARSFASLLASQRVNRLGGSFFCSRASVSRSQVHRIFPTLVHHLARRDQSYSDSVVKILEADHEESVLVWPLKMQFLKLIVGPSTDISAIQGPLVFVIDALDECSDARSVRDFLGALVHPIHDLKIFITSRPERHIQSIFSSEIQQARRLRLHDIETSIVAADIEKYLSFELLPVAQRLNAVRWPSPIDLARLVERTGQLFLFAFTAVQYLSVDDLSDGDTNLRLRKLLSDPAVDGATPLQTATMDSLYTQIFETAYAEKEPNEVFTMRLALDTIICLREPLTFAELSVLVDVTAKDLQTVLGAFRSVIDVPASFEVPVTFFHSSFSEYVQSSTRSGAYAMDTAAVNANMGLMCIQSMNTMLHQNMCGVEDKATMSEIAKADIRAGVPAALRYACMHWVAHLVLSSPSEAGNIRNALWSFAQGHLLHWLECLILGDQFHLALNLLDQVIQSVMVCKQLPEIVQIMDEARYMVPQVAPFAQHWPLQLYSSAWEWLPKTSRLRKICAQGPGHVVCGLDQRLVKKPPQTHPDPCSCVTFSPDGLYIISAYSGHVIALWDLRERSIPKTFGGQHGWIISLAFSPDGRRIACGYHNHTINVWIVDTQCVERTLVGHTSVVLCTRFSPNGSQIVSGSNDKTIRIWSMENGEMKLKLEGHEAWVMSVAFSPDGAKIVSGSGDGTVKIWDATSGDELSTFVGHSGPIYCVVFSPDGSRVASGSDDHTIRIWSIFPDVPPRILVGHSGGVLTLSFSADGSQICSGSEDNSLRIWDFKNGETSHAKQMTNRVHSVDFCRDGSNYLVSASDDRRLQVWYGPDWDCVWNAYGMHSDSVESLTFSLDGELVASGSFDKSIRIWRVETGSTEILLQGHTKSVTILAFSPNRLYLASGSRHEYNVRVWNLGTKKSTHLVSLADSGHPSCLKFSPDGHLLFCGTYDGYIAILNMETAEVRVFKLDSSYLQSVAVSPDGLSIAGGFGGAVAIFNMKGEKKQAFKNTRRLNDVAASLAFSPDGQKLICGLSGYWRTSGSIDIWDMTTGSLEEMSEVGFSTNCIYFLFLPLTTCPFRKFI
ncbi:WD40-repeat-containing domain protein [Mycena pura]|uniref:WD40-repeat-containing domain protein n=1 Tax=Mycena pura TaxID=153505 RepID=A0AAD6YJK5_9AGAR|nr:WD40-repeat-containing domain protein [Mycena pura]